MRSCSVLRTVICHADAKRTMIFPMKKNAHQESCCTTPLFLIIVR